MTDVVEIAKKRRDALAAEIGKLDDFVCMTENMLEDGGNDTDEEQESSPLNLFAGTKAKKKYSINCRDRLNCCLL